MINHVGVPLQFMAITDLQGVVVVVASIQYPIFLGLIQVERVKRSVWMVWTFEQTSLV